MHHATPKALIACLFALPFAACGDDGGGDDAAGGDGGGEAAAAFCDQANQMTDQHGASMPVYDGQQLDAEWLAEFEKIEPAPEIADEWAILASDYAEYNDAVAELDFDALEQQMAGAEMDPTNSSLPEGFAEAMADVNEAMAITQTEEHVTASNTVSQYLTDECS